MKRILPNHLFSKLRNICTSVILAAFITLSLVPVPFVQASTTVEVSNGVQLSKPGTLVEMSSAFEPMVIKGISIHPDDPFTFDFLIDTGEVYLSEDAFKQESAKLIKYFLASLTVPEKDMWVNLSPYEKNRIIPESFGQTEMGRDLLAQDYMLKQLAASLMYPEKELGEKFWKQVKQKARNQFGTTDLPMNTFNKVWIVPQEARVYEHSRGAIVVESHLDVMLEEDYLALESNVGHTDHGLGEVTADELSKKNGVSSEVIRELVIPEIEREVNEGATFANLRQIYNSMILAVWFKRALKESLLGEIYMDQARTKGIDLDDNTDNQKIYDLYVEAFKTGVYNYIKEDVDPVTQQVVPRQYFSGGAAPMTDNALVVERRAQEDVVDALADTQTRKLTVRLSRITQPTVDYALLVNDPTLQAFLDERRDVANNPIIDVSLEAAIAELEGEAGGALGKGGLGFLAGDTWGAYHHLSKFKGMGIMPLYERHYGSGRSIDWDNTPGINPVIDKDTGETLSFNVDFNMGSFPVKIYWVNRNGTPVFLIRNDNFFGSLYPGGAQQVQQYGFLARATVELTKKLEIKPRIVRLSEGQLVFVATAIQNDVEHYELRENGKKSVFKDSEIVFTTHTPERAALPVFYDLNELDNLIGSPLYNKIAEDGRVDAAVALAKMATIVNGVSDEHGDVTKVAVLPQFEEKTAAVQNGNEEATWYSPQLRKHVGEVGLKNVTGKKLFDIGKEVKENDLQDELQTTFGVKFDDPSRPLIGLVRRLVAYKEQRIFIPLIKWIVGDPEKEYFNPDTGESLGRGLGANLLIGGHALDDVSPAWVREFRRLMDDPDVKGKFLFVDGTGIELRRLAVAASDVWVSIPRPTREASGTSDGAAALNGTVNIATATGGPLSYIKHRVNGWLIDVFNGMRLDVVIRRFDQGDVSIIQQFYQEGGQQLAQYLRESVTRYHEYVRRGNRSWLETMQQSFIAAHKEVSVEAMILKYGLLFESIIDGTGARGYNEKKAAFKYVPEGLEDAAMLSKNKGGIDLNPESLTLMVDKQGQGLIVPQWQPIQNMDNVLGLQPIILNVSPVLNLPVILGLRELNEEQEITLSAQ